MFQKFSHDKISLVEQDTKGGLSLGCYSGLVLAGF